MNRSQRMSKIQQILKLKIREVFIMLSHNVAEPIPYYRISN